jgi:hypothetical protein
MRSWLLLFLLLTFVLVCLAATPDGLPAALTYRESRVGLIELGQVDPARPPAECTDFSAACAAANASNYALSFTLLESKYARCGHHRWQEVFRAHGSTNAIVVKETPCGNKVLIKAPLMAAFECQVLIQLTSGARRAACPRCFPDGYLWAGESTVCGRSW